MAIPTQRDRALGEIDDLHGCVMTALRTQKHAADRDLPRIRAELRERLQCYVDKVMMTAGDRA